MGTDGVKHKSDLAKMVLSTQDMAGEKTLLDHMLTEKSSQATGGDALKWEAMQMGVCTQDMAGVEPRLAATKTAVSILAMAGVELKSALTMA